MAYAMELRGIIALLNVVDSNVSDIKDVSITSLDIDSRAVTAGSLFIAYPGVSVDGRDYILDAQNAGASAVVYQAGIELPDAVAIPAFAVDDLQTNVGDIANHFFKEPSSELQVFGITGTNGKTSCCYLLTQAFEALGMQAAMIGTIGVGPLGLLKDSGHTTPNPVAVHQLLAEFRDQGITQVCMEVSSHALDQGRVNGVAFFCTLFTNLSHDHLDYHGDMESYVASKQRLFTDFHSELVITNASDPMGGGLIDVANSDFVVRYGAGGDVFADDVELTANGIDMVIEGSGVEFELSTCLVGKVNVPNIELVVATLLALSTSVDDIQTIVAGLRAAPGRMDVIRSADNPSVVIDYAHTPDALEKAMLSVKKHCRGQLWCVFGCGGDRDQYKRGLMGAVAEKIADKVVVTNDNPRSETPKSIANDIVAGMTNDGAVWIELDRANAIRFAVENAANDDWVLLAGKGHETTQTIGDDVFLFSDKEQAIKILGVSQ